MSDIQHLKTFYEDDTDYENKKNIHSPPNEFIMLSKYEDSLDTSNRKLYSDSTSIVSSSSDNDSISEIDSFRSNFRLKMNKTLHKDLQRGPRSRSLYNKKKNIFDVVNEDESENEIESEKQSTLHKRHYSNFKIFNNIMNNNYNTLDSIKISHKIASEKLFVPFEMEPVFEVEEVDKPENNKKISSSRLKLFKDSKEETISNTKTHHIYASGNIYDQIVDSIAEDNNENVMENETKSSKIHKKIENFTDKLDDINEINSDLCIKIENVQSIKEENNEDEEFNVDKLNNSGFLQFADELDKVNLPKTNLRLNHSAIVTEEDQILENEEEIKYDNNNIDNEEDA